MVKHTQTIRWQIAEFDHFVGLALKGLRIRMLVNIEIKDHYIGTCKSTKLRTKLLCKQDLTLEKLQEISRNEEGTNYQVTDNEEDKEIGGINALNSSFHGMKLKSEKKNFKQAHKIWGFGKMWESVIVQFKMPKDVL